MSVLLMYNVTMIRQLKSSDLSIGSMMHKTRQPKFVNVDEDGNLRGETRDITNIFDEKKTLGSAFITLFYNLWYWLKASLGLP
ncbi:unnamed protein product [Schistosoma spindalis]|nr:unnamed protein product [Schistosoma spindale]